MIDSSLDNIPKDYLCPITLEIMIKPAVAADGHSYEYSAILDWFKKGNRHSPMTGEKLTNGVLIENHRLRAII